MGKKRKSGSVIEERDPPARPSFNSPFKDLNKLLKEHAAARPQPLPAPATTRAPRNAAVSQPSPAITQADEEAFLREALAGVASPATAAAPRTALHPRLDRRADHDATQGPA